MPPPCCQRRLRVATGGIIHETNTFATQALGLTTRAQFDRLNPGVGPLVGRAILDAHSGVASNTGGFIDAAAELDIELVPLLFGNAGPSGTIADAAFEDMLREFIGLLRSAMPVDAVALDLHGAGVAESYEEIELTLALAIREVVGRDVPIVAAWDLHGNISEACAEAFDFMCCCRYYPHTDLYERGMEAMRLLPSLISKELVPAVHLHRIPVLLPLCMMGTGEGFPAHDLNQVCAELEARPGVIDVTAFHGFPYADITIAGASVIATTDGDLDLARQCAEEVGAWLVDNLERFRLRITSGAEAVAQALAVYEGERPVVINDTSDNTGAGAPGDATNLLRALLDCPERHRRPGQGHRCVFGQVRAAHATVLLMRFDILDIECTQPAAVVKLQRCVCDDVVALRSTTRRSQLRLTKWGWAPSSVRWGWEGITCRIGAASRFRWGGAQVGGAVQNRT